MTKDKLRLNFSQRLKEAMDSKNILPRERAKTIAKWLGKNEKNPEFARKWLTGLSMPQRDNLQIICAKLEIRPEWLEYGLLPKTLFSAILSPSIRELMLEFEDITEDEREALAGVLRAMRAK